MSFRKKIRRPVQAVLRGFHRAFFSRPLPDRLGLYFHSLDAHELPVFAEAVNRLKSEGYSFVSPGEFLTAPGRVAYISFDDNHEEWFRALPSMQDLGVRCTFFVNTSVLRGECTDAAWDDYCRVIKYSGGGRPLSRDEIRALADAGHTIGAHTHSHLAMPYYSDEVLAEDLRTNRRMLEEITGREVTDFAFPFGMPRYFPPRLLPLVQRAGFRTVSYATAGMQYAQGGPFAIQRTQWTYHRPADWNIRNLRVNGQWFVKLTGLSPVG